MLRSKALKRLLALRNIHASKINFQNSGISEVKPASQNNHFKDEEDLTSVQERALFEQVFENIMKKEDIRKKNSGDIYLESFSIAQSNEKAGLDSDGKGLQVVFEKKNDEIQAGDKKLFDFFKNTSGSNTSSDIGESAKLTTDDIRNYPVSLVSSIFPDNNSESLTNTEKPPSKKLLKNILDIAPSKIQISSDLGSRLDKQILKKLEAKEKFNAAMDNVLKPYFAVLSLAIQTDYDLLEHVRDSLQKYTNRDKTNDADNFKSPDKIIEFIRDQCDANSTILPKPYSITLPYVLVKLLKSEDFNFPSERKYTVASYIYRECKKCADISLYLNVCNVDFYNSLLQLSWDNFRDVYQLRQLTTEMSINGIRGDIYSVEILDKVVQELRHINDGILDEDTGKLGGKPPTVGVVWCRESSMDLTAVENYLKKLKESLI